MPDVDPQDQPSPEDPNRFRPQPEVSPLDEPPPGRTPSDPNDPTPESLPPGAKAAGDRDDAEDDQGG
jgi:hypothetical protein